MKVNSTGLGKTTMVAHFEELSKVNENDSAAMKLTIEATEPVHWTIKATVGGRRYSRVHQARTQAFNHMVGAQNADLRWKAQFPGKEIVTQPKTMDLARHSTERLCPEWRRHPSRKGADLGKGL